MEPDDALVDRARLIARAAGVPEELFLSQVMKESRWDPTVISHVGARGLTQIMPDTAETYGLDWDRVVNDPEYQLESGAQIMADLYEEFGSWPLALSAYNAGPGVTGRTVDAEYQPVPPYRETQEYVLDILAPLEESEVMAREGRPQMRPRALPERAAVAAEDPGTPEATAARARLLEQLYFERGPMANYDVVEREYRPRRPAPRPEGIASLPR